MSYILDALRRADAERERGGVPSIHTQQQFTPFGGDDDAEAPSRRLRWVVAGLAVALVAAVAWILLRPSSEAPLVPVPRTIGVLPQPAAGPPPTLAGPTGTTGTAAMPGANPPGPATVPPTTPAPGTAVALAPPTAPLATTTPPGGSPSPMTPPPRRAPRQGPPPSSDRTSAASREGGARAAAQETQGPADPSTPVKTAPDKAAPEKTGHALTPSNGLSGSFAPVRLAMVGKKSIIEMSALETRPAGTWPG